jgi:hypothetical protein
VALPVPTDREETTMTKEFERAEDIRREMPRTADIRREAPRNPFDTLREDPFEDDEQAQADAWVLETAIERGLLSEADAIALQIEGAARGYRR